MVPPQPLSGAASAPGLPGSSPTSLVKTARYLLMSRCPHVCKGGESHLQLRLVGRRKQVSVCEAPEGPSASCCDSVVTAAAVGGQGAEPADSGGASCLTSQQACQGAVEMRREAGEKTGPVVSVRSAAVTSVMFITFCHSNSRKAQMQKSSEASDRCFTY